VKHALWLWLPPIVLLTAHLVLSTRAQEPTVLIRTDRSDTTVASDSTAAHAASPADTSDTAAVRPAGGDTASDTAARCINVNTADKATLTHLHGIGEVLAQRIIDYRTEHGGYTDAESLLKVKGIGPVKLAGIRDRICF
jgi:competence ComEA-like helix-hairpin-helix protein